VFSLPTILAYHAVGTVQPADDPLDLFLSPETFAKQMQFLSRHRRVVPLAEAVDRRYEHGQSRVAITFDDGYRCLIQHALPVLREFGFPATLFVPTSAIGDRNRWDPGLPIGLEIMSIEELREADARGLTVESHGHSHINLANTTITSARDDLARSVEILTDLLGRAPSLLAYPYGQVTRDVEEAASQLGFAAAFTIGTRDRGALARARVPIRRRGDGSWQYRLQTSGYWPALRFSRVGYPIRTAARAVSAKRGNRTRR
jgi:peptidoglycan/xylan/chitin deacetylase (PgdA/CDA1 family)